MSNEKRIIPCLDIDQGRVVKGRKFKNVQDVADPLELAIKYSEAGADELVFYDISASIENRSIFIDLIQTIAQQIDIPFTVGGGIRTLEDMELIFSVGVDKVSINSIAIENPLIIKEAAKRFGSDRLVLSVDVKEESGLGWFVYKRGGRENTGLDAIRWIVQGERLGAGEVVVNHIDSDGEKNGYQIELTKTVAESVNIPVIASGGAGQMEHFIEALTIGKASGALAASVFHYDEIDIRLLKKYLKENSSLNKDDNS